MIRTLKEYVEQYSDKGLLNKEAIVELYGSLDNQPLKAFDEFVLDACAYANHRIGGLIRGSHGMPQVHSKAWEFVVSHASKCAVALWESHGYRWPESSMEQLEQLITRYLCACFNARLRGTFRNNEKERARLYAAMARVGCSRAYCREKLDEVLKTIDADRFDFEYTDAYLDEVVARCVQQGIIRAN